MKKSDLIRTYDSIQPDEQTYDRVWERITEAAHDAPPARPVRRRVFLIAACIALIAVLSGIGYATYQKWSLPKPETYELTENVNKDIQQSNEYDTVEENPEELTDEYFIAKAVEIFETVGLTDIDTGKMTVNRQEDLYWDRSEAEVFFTEDENHTSVCFNARTGALISLFGIDWAAEGAAACETWEEADALAAHYYSLLPVPQGYVMTGHTEYDEQYWSYEFCREAADGIYSYYEMVRVMINPKSGRLNGCVVFSVPLLDDHEPGDIPLTQEQAEAIALDRAIPDNFDLRSATVEVVMPNWTFSDKLVATGLDTDLKASTVTRLGWVLIYEYQEDGMFDSEIHVWIDYYTGEILGGTMV